MRAGQRGGRAVRAAGEGKADGKDYPVPSRAFGSRVDLLRGGGYNENMDEERIRTHKGQTEEEIREAELRASVPRRRLPQNVITVVLQLVAAALVAASFVIAAKAYEILPDRIGIHFNASGEIDGYGGKGALFIGGGFCAAAFLFMTLGNYIKVRWKINLILPVYVDTLADDDGTRTKIYRLLSVAWNLTLTLFIAAMFFVGLSACRQDKFEWVGFGICLAGCLAAALGSVFVGASVLSRGKEKKEPDDAPPAD